jgi:hypothetical protein
MGRAIAATRAQFAHFLGERLKPETRWRSEVNSNYRYRFCGESGDFGERIDRHEKFLPALRLGATEVHVHFPRRVETTATRN